MEVVASPSQGRTAAAQCGLFTYKSVPVIFEPPCSLCAVNRFIVVCGFTLLTHKGRCSSAKTCGDESQMASTPVYFILCENFI